MGDHRIRKVPRCDRRDNPNGLFHHQDALIDLMARDDVAIDATGFFRKPLDEACPIGNFTFRFRQWLALPKRENRCQIILVRHDQIEPLAHHLTAFFRRSGGPDFLCCLGGVDRRISIRSTELGYKSYDGSSCRAVDRNTGLGTDFHPGAADKGRLAEKR